MLDITKYISNPDADNLFDATGVSKERAKEIFDACFLVLSPFAGKRMKPIKLFIKCLTEVKVNNEAELIFLVSAADNLTNK